MSRAAPRYGDDVLLWIEQGKARDPDQERLDRQQLVDAGAMTRNELRTAPGLPPMEGGDVPAGRRG